MKHYPTNFADSQWMLLNGILNDNCKRKHSLRDIFNFIFYLIKTGCQWHMIPGCFPNWKLVYYYFIRWKDDGVIEQVHELLGDKIRKRTGKFESPSLARIDNQSIMATRLGGEYQEVMVKMIKWDSNLKFQWISMNCEIGNRFC